MRTLEIERGTGGRAAQPDRYYCGWLLLSLAKQNAELPDGDTRVSQEFGLAHHLRELAGLSEAFYNGHIFLGRTAAEKSGATPSR